MYLQCLYNVYPVFRHCIYNVYTNIYIYTYYTHTLYIQNTVTSRNPPGVTFPFRDFSKFHVRIEASVFCSAGDAVLASVVLEVLKERCFVK